jgi:predicted nucleic acid-binding protein
MRECCGSAPHRTAIADLWNQMRAAERAIQPTEEDWREGWAAYERGPVGGPGVVDLISFRVMHRLGITRAFTNDRHFRTAGFEVLF